MPSFFRTHVGSGTLCFAVRGKRGAFGPDLDFRFLTPTALRHRVNPQRPIVTSFVPCSGGWRLDAGEVKGTTRKFGGRGNSLNI